MKQYTIRNISERLDNRLRSISEKQRISLNALVIDMLMSAAGLKDDLPVHHDLDELARIEPVELLVLEDDRLTGRKDLANRE